MRDIQKDMSTWQVARDAKLKLWRKVRCRWDSRDICAALYRQKERHIWKCLLTTAPSQGCCPVTVPARGSHTHRVPKSRAKVTGVRTGNGPPNVNLRSSQPVADVMHREVTSCARQTLSLRNRSKEAETEREMPTSGSWKDATRKPQGFCCPAAVAYKCLRCASQSESWGWTLVTGFKGNGTLVLFYLDCFVHILNKQSLT